MIACVFFGQSTETAPIAAALDALIGTSDVDGCQMGVRPRDQSELERAADGAVVVVHSGAPSGVVALVDAEARRRGLIPTVVAAPVPWLLARREHDRAIWLAARGFGPFSQRQLALIGALRAAGIDVGLEA